MTPDTTKDLLMNPGDRVRIHMHDTAAGFRIDLTDLTTRQQRLDDRVGRQRVRPHPVHAGLEHLPGRRRTRSTPSTRTGNPRGNTWSAHTYNVAMSDEIGHFENCLQLDADFNCAVPGTQDPRGLDPDDDNNFCVPGDGLARS